MRDLFPGYYRPTDQEFQSLWAEGIFAFDANVLLNIYRYSKDTREAFLEILNRLKDRIWLPNQAALEYQENRLTVLSAQFKAYDDIPKLVKSALSELETLYPRHPFIPVAQVTDVLQKAISEITKSLDEAKRNHPDLIEADVLREALTEIFHGRVGQAFDAGRLEQIYKEGETRFQKLIPPGYRDAKKDSDKRYGDLILWNQLKDFGKAENKSLVLVTDDRKDDWWQEHKGKTIGPRPELIQEMRADANISFYMYQSDKFIEYAQKLFGLEPGTVLEEVREVRAQETVQKEIENDAVWTFHHLGSDAHKYRNDRLIAFNRLEEALIFLSIAPRTFSELKEYFNNDSKLARTFLQYLIAHELVTVDSSKKPHRFSLAGEAEQLASELLAFGWEGKPGALKELLSIFRIFAVGAN